MGFKKNDNIKEHQPNDGFSTDASNKTEKEDITKTYDWQVTNQFIERLVQEVTFGCSLPFMIPKTRIPQIVEKCAKWCFRNAESASEERWFVVRNCDLAQIANKTVRLPDQIIAIADCQLLNSEFQYSMNKAHFNLEHILTNTIGFYPSSPGAPGFNYVGPASNLQTNIQEDIFMSMFEIGQLEAILKRTVTFNFNPNTHKLVILGDNEGCDLVLLTSVRISLHDLFNDERFLKYCTGECMKELKTIMAVFGFRMPGNVQLNYGEYKERGQELIDEAKDEYDNDNAGDCFFSLT